MNRTLTASTLPELLVAMIVIGIIFLATMDGYGIADRFRHRLASYFTDAALSADSYYRLERLLARIDSVSGPLPELILYRDGSIYGILKNYGKSLIFSTEGRRPDTVVTNVERFDVSVLAGRMYLIDTLFVGSAGHPGLIRFSVSRGYDFTRTKRIIKREKEVGNE